jgi:ATP-dependent helicase/nuclease subunit A
MSVRVVPEATRRAQHRASDPAASVWVSANAGSGKTHVLAQRVLRLLLDGTPPGRILCLTFTKAAAANMAARIYAELSRWTQLDDEGLRTKLIATGLTQPRTSDLELARRLFARAVETPGGLKIQTIHAFCERLLHLFPFEANVPARFDVLDEAGAAELMARAKAESLAAAATNQGARGRALRFIAGETSAGEAGAATFDGLLREALQQRTLMRQPQSAPALRAALNLPPDIGTTDVDRDILENGLPIAAWLDLAALFAQGGVQDNKRAALLRSVDALFRSNRDEPAALAQCSDLYRQIFFTKEGKPAAQLASKAVEALRPGFRVELAAEQARLVAREATRLATMTFERTCALFDLVEGVLETYDSLKAARGLLDFSDLVGRTLALLDRSDAQWVLYKLDAGIDHILVDEAQDTSEPQWRVFEALTTEFSSGLGATAGPRTFFAVGDDKQSIFSFQGAAPSMFHDMRGRFAQRLAAAGQRFEHVQLKTSFRSAPGVLAAVDGLFEPQAHQRGLVYAGDVWPIHEAVKTDLPALVEIWPPQGPAAVADPEDWRVPLDTLAAHDPPSLVASRIAQKIATLCDPRTGERVHDETHGGLRPIRPSDVLILVRTRSAFFTAIIRALKAAGVPVAGADRLQLGAHIATRDLVAAGRAALLPDDDLTLAAVLKSPLIDLDDDDLIALAPSRSGSLYAALADSREARHQAAYAKIETWRTRAAAGSPFAFYMALLSEDGGRRALEARLGAESCDVVDEFVRLTLDFEGRSSVSLLAFLTAFDAADLEIKRDMETSADAVRVMTVHAAKGLEAKIVFLPDTCGAPGGRHDAKLFYLPGDAQRTGVLAWSPRMDLDPPAVQSARAAARAAAEEEHRRLLYVAMTRAEERLYIAGFHGVNGPGAGCWNEMITHALATTCEAFPAFWDEGVEILRRITQGSAGLVQVKIASVATNRPLSEPSWLRTSAPSADVPNVVRPSRAMSARAGTSTDTNARQRGRLVHLLLQHLPTVAVDRRRAVGIAMLAAKAPDLDAAGRETLLEETISVLEDHELKILFDPDGRTEIDIAGTLTARDGSEHPVIGRVDRFVVSDHELLIADFKLSNDSRPSPAAMLQLALYRAVLAPLWPGKTIRALLIHTSGPTIHHLSPGTLDSVLQRYLAESRT